MLDFKGIEYRTVDLVPVLHKAVIRGLGFGGTTVPALKFNGEKILGSIPIARALDRLVPEPPLLPPEGDPRRTEVLAAETFGERELQQGVRQIRWNTLRRRPRSIGTFLEGSNLLLPPSVAGYASGPVIRAEYRLNKATDENTRAIIAGLPGWLGHLDGWVDSGILGAETPNAADFQILASVGLMMRLQDFRPHVENRPVGRAAKRLYPDYPGDVPPTLPPEWLTSLSVADGPPSAADGPSATTP